MRPQDNPPDVTEAAIDTQGWHLDIPASALVGKTFAEIRTMIETTVTVLKGDDRIPFNDWIEQNLSKNEPSKGTEPGALVHREIYPFREM